MARCARAQSVLDIYHVILRGVDRQIIFEEENDYLTFISILKYYKKITNFKLYSYCLMNNHVHLLIGSGDEPLSVTMKRIEVKFARWYNAKYERSGYLFQDRFKSEPVNDVRYLLTVFRYIHQNPWNAGIELSVGDYPWSSYREYMTKNMSWIDKDIILPFFETTEKCMDFLNCNTDEICMEYYSASHIPDEVAQKIMEKCSGCKNPSDLKKLDIDSRNEVLQKMAKRGLRVKQISRLTGVSRGIVGKIIRRDQEGQ